MPPVRPPQTRHLELVVGVGGRTSWMRPHGLDVVGRYASGWLAGASLRFAEGLDASGGAGVSAGAGVSGAPLWDSARARRHSAPSDERACVKVSQVVIRWRPLAPVRPPLVPSAGRIRFAWKLVPLWHKGAGGAHFEPWPPGRFLGTRAWAVLARATYVSPVGPERAEVARRGAAGRGGRAPPCWRRRPRRCCPRAGACAAGRA